MSVTVTAVFAPAAREIVQFSHSENIKKSVVNTLFKDFAFNLSRSMIITGSKQITFSAELEKFTRRSVSQLCESIIEYSNAKTHHTMYQNQQDIEESLIEITEANAAAAEKAFGKASDAFEKVKQSTGISVEFLIA